MPDGRSTCHTDRDEGGGAEAGSACSAPEGAAPGDGPRGASPSDGSIASQKGQRGRAPSRWASSPISREEPQEAQRTFMGSFGVRPEKRRRPERRFPSLAIGGVRSKIEWGWGKGGFGAVAFKRAGYSRSSGSGMRDVRPMPRSSLPRV